MFLCSIDFKTAVTERKIRTHAMKNVQTSFSVKRFKEERTIMPKKGKTKIKFIKEIIIMF